jgi:hypothetical protein
MREFPAYADFESRSPAEFLNEDAGTNLTDQDTSATPPIAGGTIRISGSAPVPSNLPAGTWYVALAVAPGETLNLCPAGGGALLDGPASDAEAVVFRPAPAGEPGWGLAAGARSWSARPGTAISSSSPVRIYADRITVKAGDLIDASAETEIRDTLPSSGRFSPVTTVVACMFLDRTPLGPCSRDDISDDQLHRLTFPISRSVLYRLPPAFGPKPRPATVALTLRTAGTAASSPPARDDGIGNLSVVAYRSPR